MSLLNFTSNKRAIAYYRHSAEDKQENSVAIQRDHAQRFARRHSIEIIHEEADEGISGLSADRPGFQNLFNNWILNESAPSFKYVLVYDVSRWGRFQNPDEGAMYQYRCAERGKKLIFVERGKLEEEQALSAHLVTSIERYMAAEYSRQLSNKVFYGSERVSKEGYSAGGTACYGMSRLLLDVNKNPVRILKKGEHKQISNERVTFVPTNDEATQTVRKIFTLCANSLGPIEIAHGLNNKKIPSANGGLWNCAKVLRILRNEAYLGTRIYNKRWSRLKQKSRRNPRNEWIICPEAFPAIVTQEIFDRAQENLRKFVAARPTVPRHIHMLRKQINTDLKNWLITRHIDEIDVLRIIQDFPITVSVSYARQDAFHWCIGVSERMKNHEIVFAVALPPKSDISAPPKIFCIPVNRFEQNNFLIFSNEEKKYQEYLLSGEQIEMKFRFQLETMLSKLMTRA